MGHSTIIPPRRAMPWPRALRFRPAIRLPVVLPQGAFQFRRVYPGQVSNQGTMTRQLQANNPAIVRVPAVSYSPVSAGTSTETCTTCTSSTVVKEGVCSVCPYPSGCPSDTNSVSLTAPGGYSPKSYKAVYPRPSTCKCNEYYVQTCPGKTRNRCRRILWRMVAPLV